MNDNKWFLLWIMDDYNDYDSVLNNTKTEKQSLDNFMYNSTGSLNFGCGYCGSEEYFEYKKFDFFKCKKCKRQYRAKTNTLFHESKLKYSQLIRGCYLVMNGNISTYELANEIKVSQKTAWLFKELIKGVWNIK